MKKKLALKNIVLIVSLFIVSFTFGQNKSIKVSYFYPKDSIEFNQQFDDIEFNHESTLYGKTTMIVHCESDFGIFDFIFKKRIFKLSRILDYKNSSVSEDFDFKTKKWKLAEYSNPYPKGDNEVVDITNFSQHNLYALIIAHDRAGVIQKSKFQDFGNEVYWPEFDYPNCLISDENKDGSPEFYLSYIGNSDGLDSKPYKQIVYTFNSQNIEKSKATSYYPAGNEGDEYRIEYDENWKKLPVLIQKKSQKLTKDHKVKYETQ